MIYLIFFYGVPLAVMGLAVQMRFFHNWRFFLSLCFAGYIALWAYPLVYDLVKPSLPGELLPWGRAVIQGGVLGIVLILISQICVSLSSHGGGGYHLPRRRNISCFILGFVTGWVVSALLSYLVCLSPLHCKIAQTEAFSQKAVARLTIFTTIMDKISCQGKSAADRKRLLTERVYPLRDPVKIAEQKAKEAKAAAAKAAAEKAAAEKAAAEKAAYEAEQEALKRKREKSSRVEDHFEAERYGGRVRDSHPRQEKKKTPEAEKVKSRKASSDQASVQSASPADRSK